jgi:hypothetical protein
MAHLFWRGMFGALFALSLLHHTPTHPSPTAILVDEFDAGRFECTANGQIIGSRQGRVKFGEFRTSYRAQPHE